MITLKDSIEIKVTVPEKLCISQTLYKIQNLVFEKKSTYSFNII
jgi:hypothetical protein